MKNIIVTGGAGYIGSHTIIELVNAGYNPIIIDNLCNSSIKNIEGIEQLISKKVKWYNSDCTDRSAMRKIFTEESNIEAVIHFAAYKSVEESILNPEKYYENNIKSLETVLECMDQFKINNLIFSSSCTVYGIPRKLPIKENAKFNKATSPYGETKQHCERLIQEHNCNSISLRYFNPIGAHKSALIGDLSIGKPTNLIPIITDFALGKRTQLKVYGTNYNTADGSCIRDYIHVVDLAKSHVLALDYLFNKPAKYAFNVGTGKGLSVIEAIELFGTSNNLKLKYTIGTERIGDIAEIYADNSLIKKELNWKQELSLEQAMIDAWERAKRTLS